MDQTQLHTVVQYAAGAVGIACLAALVALDKLDVSVALPVIVAILGGLGIYESGRRKGLRQSPALPEVVREVLEAIGGVAVGGGTAAESTPPPSPASSATGSGERPRTEAVDPQTAVLRERIDTASHQTLQAVGGHLDGVDGSGRTGDLQTALEGVAPGRLAEAFAAVDGDGRGES